jgi:hypothetical protein
MNTVTNKSHEVATNQFAQTQFLATRWNLSLRRNPEDDVVNFDHFPNTRAGISIGEHRSGLLLRQLFRRCVEQQSAARSR